MYYRSSGIRLGGWDREACGAVTVQSGGYSAVGQSARRDSGRTPGARGPAPPLPRSNRLAPFDEQAHGFGYDYAPGLGSGSGCWRSASANSMFMLSSRNWDSRGGGAAGVAR